MSSRVLAWSNSSTVSLNSKTQAFLQTPPNSITESFPIKRDDFFFVFCLVVLFVCLGHFLLCFCLSVFASLLIIALLTTRVFFAVPGSQFACLLFPSDPGQRYVAISSLLLSKTFSNLTQLLKVRKPLCTLESDLNCVHQLWNLDVFPCSFFLHQPFRLWQNLQDRTLRTILKLSVS